MTKKIIAINLTILFLGFGLIELLFGSWFGKSQIHLLNIPRNVELNFTLNGLYGNSGERVLYKRDRYGLRGQYSDPSKIDILSVGGSTTDQRYITEGATFQDVLASEFKKHGNDITVVNAGIDGQSSIGNIRDFEVWFPEIPGLHAKYVLLYTGTNDFVSRGRKNFWYDEMKAESTWARKLMKNSAFYYLYRTIMGMYLARPEVLGNSMITEESLRPKNTKPHFTDLEGYRKLAKGMLDGYRESLLKLSEKIHEFGATPIFVSQRDFRYLVKNGEILDISEPFTVDGVELNGKDAAHLWEVFAEVSMGVCKQVGGICIDLRAELEFQPGDFYDRYHTTASGSRRIGEYLYRKLKPVIAP